MMGWMDASEALAVCGTDRRPAMGNHGSTRGTRRQVRETRTRAGCRGHAVRATREWSRGRARGRNTRVPVASGKSRTCTDANVRLEEGEARAAPWVLRSGDRRDGSDPVSECNSSESQRKTEGLMKLDRDRKSHEQTVTRGAFWRLKKKKKKNCSSALLQTASHQVRLAPSRTGRELQEEKKRPRSPRTTAVATRVARGVITSPRPGAHRLDRLVPRACARRYAACTARLYARRHRAASRAFGRV